MTLKPVRRQPQLEPDRRVGGIKDRRPDQRGDGGLRLLAVDQLLPLLQPDGGVHRRRWRLGHRLGRRVGRQRVEAALGQQFDGHEAAVRPLALRRRGAAGHLGPLPLQRVARPHRVVDSLLGKLQASEPAVQDAAVGHIVGHRRVKRRFLRKAADPVVAFAPDAEIAGVAVFRRLPPLLGDLGVDHVEDHAGADEADVGGRVQGPDRQEEVPFQIMVVGVEEPKIAAQRCGGARVARPPRTPVPVVGDERDALFGMRPRPTQRPCHGVVGGGVVHDADMDLRVGLAGRRAVIADRRKHAVERPLDRVLHPVNGNHHRADDIPIGAVAGDPGQGDAEAAVLHPGRGVETRGLVVASLNQPQNAENMSEIAAWRDDFGQRFNDRDRLVDPPVLHQQHGLVEERSDHPLDLPFQHGAVSVQPGGADEKRQGLPPFAGLMHRQRQPLPGHGLRRIGGQRPTMRFHRIEIVRHRPFTACAQDTAKVRQARSPRRMAHGLTPRKALPTAVIPRSPVRVALRKSL